MHIKELELTDFCVHRHLKVSCNGSLVGLIGENGTGKSSLLKGLAFAITGRVSGEQHRVINWYGANKAVARVCLDVDGVELRITRSISRASKTDPTDVTSAATLNFGEETVTGVNKVNARVEEILGIDRDAFKTAVFVTQGDIDTILFSNPTGRQNAWLKLVGISDVPKLYDKIGKIIAAMPKVEDLGAALSEAKANLATAQANQAGRDVSWIPAAIAKETAEVTAIGNEVAERNAALAKIKQIALLQSQLAAAESVLEATPVVEDTREELRERYKALSEKIGATTAQNKMVQQAKQNAANLAEAKARLAKANEDLASWTAQLDTLTPGDELEAGDAMVAELKATQMSLSQQINTTEKLLAAVSAVGVKSSCPLCNSEIKDASSLISKIKADVAALIAQRNSAAAEAAETTSMLVELRRANETVTKGVREASDKIRQLTEKIEHLENSAFDGAGDLVDVAPLQKALQDIEATGKAIAAKLASRTDAEAKVEKARHALTQVSASAGLDSEDELHDRLSDLAARRLVHEGEIEGLRQQLQEAELDARVVKMESERVAKIEESIAANIEYSTKLQSIVKVREWFHYSNGPRLVLNNILGSVTDAVNNVLEMFDSYFRVTPDAENLSFRYYYLGKEMPEQLPSVEECSGGERVVLAAAFRFASYCMFAGSAGLLVLDEPTVYLDKRNVGKFNSLLYKIKELSDRLGLQVIVATHEQGILQSCESIINLGEK